MATHKDLFLSEVHVEDCPPGQGEWTTVFTGVFDLPHVDLSSECCDAEEGKSVDGDTSAGCSQALELDEDGDLVVPRRKTCNHNRVFWTVQHCRCTMLEDVGTQVSSEAQD